MAGRFLPLFKLLLSALALLVAAQTFNGVLTLSSLERLYTDLYSAGFRIAGQDAASKVETALKLGKPLDNFFGFDRLVKELKDDLPDLASVALVLADGTVAAVDPPLPRDLADRIGPEVTRLLTAPARGGIARGRAPPTEEAAGETPPSTQAPEAQILPGVQILKEPDHHAVILPLRDAQGQMRGALALAYSTDILKSRLEEALKSSTLGLIVASLLAGLLLMMAVRQILHVAQEQGRISWRLLAIPAAVLVVAQVAASVQSLQVFRDAYLTAARDNTQALMEQVRQDVEFLLGKGLPLTRLRGIDSRLEAMIGGVPELARLSLIDEAGETRYVVTAPTAGDAPGRGLSLSGLDAEDPRLDLRLPLRVADGTEDLRSVGAVAARLDPRVIDRTLRDRVLDAATVLLVSLFFMIELFLLFSLAVQQSLEGQRERAPRSAAVAAYPSGPQDRLAPDKTGDERDRRQRSGGRIDQETVNRVLMARPVGFALLVAWAMPLSFIPLRMEGLPDSGLAVSHTILLALPLSVEALFALIATLLAGRLSDRLGWRVPLFLGYGLSLVAATAAGLADQAVTFIAARGLTGLGYGLAWMGLQAYVVQTAPAVLRGRGMSNLVAGFLAGFLCGTAVGAMTAERFGFEAVFLTSGGLMLAPAVMTLILLRRPATATAAAAAAAAKAAPAAAAAAGVAPVSAAPSPVVAAAEGGIVRLMRDPLFLAVMLLSVVPFSVAQMGLLYFSVPLYLSDLGLGQSNIGRIMMVYGISVIYLGPMIARWVDRADSPRPFIVLGGLIGGSGLALLSLWGGVGMVVLAVFLLGLASGICEPSRAAFVTTLASVRTGGATGAMSLQRAADRLGQMVGPLLLGSLFAVTGIEGGVSWIGFGYLAASLLFLLVSRTAARAPDEAEDPADTGDPPPAGHGKDGASLSASGPPPPIPPDAGAGGMTTEEGTANSRPVPGAS